MGRLDQETPIARMETTSSAPTQLPDHFKNLAKQLMLIHGSIRLARERNGLHFYLACPECLEDYGEVELDKKHLAVNVERYFSGLDRSAQCMKHGGSFNVTDLVSMPRLSERGIEFKPEILELDSIPAHYLERDEAGHWIPKSPGLTIPVHIVPPDHPARVYLGLRQYDVNVLWNQFQCSFCYKENSDVFYRGLSGGFKVTSQGRVIFFAYVKGVRVGWQARILEGEDEECKFYYHPYRKDWVPVMTRETVNSPWVPMEGFEGWDPAKYFTGHGTRRNSILLGFDAAVSYHQNTDRCATRWCALVEGPLDAGRFGPPFIAMMGKSFSQEQANLIRSEFDHVILIPDNDQAGKQSKDSVLMQFAQHSNTGKGTKVTCMDLPPNTKDPGALSPKEADSFLQIIKNQIL